VGATIVITAGGQADPLQGRLKQLFPAATAFSPKGGEPPHITAYAGPGTQNVIGYAFFTTEVAPLERGYGGPIVMLA
jgi:transcriptional regulator of nitric oxide reductase